MPAVSIVVPVYNTKQYIDQCLESVLKQSFEDWEMLLVDDGSTDGCAEICDRYAARDKRIRVFHKPNEGLPATREFGVAHATGLYIVHVDSDDWVEPDMLEKLHSKADSEDADVVICDFYMDYPHRKVVCHNDFTDIHDTKQVLRDCIEGKVTGYIWNRMVKASCYSDGKVLFPAELGYGEDMIHNVQLLSQPIRVAYVPEVLYHYIQNPSSMLRKDPAMVIGKLRQKTEWIARYVGEDYKDELLHLEYKEMVLAFRYGLVTASEFYSVRVPMRLRVQQMKMNGPRLNLCLVFLALGMYSVGNGLRKILFRTGK